VSAAVSRLRAEADARLPGPDEPRRPGELQSAIAWLVERYALSRAAAEEAAAYLAEGKRALGVVPTRETLALERFFDEAGGMQLVLHAPFGSRINRAWGLALRKKFCQSFNFELQAAATEDGLILSLGAAHSFALADVYRYVHPQRLRETLVQAVLASPIFATRWRWVTTLALAVPRSRNGARLPAQIQRMMAEDLLAAVFPDAAACLDNIQGAREVPEHPLVGQALRDCLEEAMDAPALERLLERVFSGELKCVARDTPEPSVFCHEILNSEVYTFLDDAPLEERRTRAVYTRRAGEPRSADDLGALDPAAIARVREEAWPEANTPDELHDALMLAGFIRADEAAPGWRTLLGQLIAAGRAFDAGPLWIALERFGELDALIPQPCPPALPERLKKPWSREDAARELVRSRLDVLGPVTARTLAGSLGFSDTAIAEGALAALEREGKVLRGRFTSASDAELEWCDRRLLARIHRYTLNRLRAEIEPVTAAQFMRFLAHWQHAAAEDRMLGVEGLAAVVEQLDGFELAAAAWESDVLAARVQDYAGEQLDSLCLSGRVAWARVTPPGNAKSPLKSSPIALMRREHAPLWRTPGAVDSVELGSEARAVRSTLQSRGASFFHEIVAATGLLRTQVERALGELAGAGLVSADSFSGLRALLVPPDKRKGLAPGGRRRAPACGVDTAGRWALLAPEQDATRPGDERTEAIARVLLKRYGVVFRALLARESRVPAWRELARVCRRLEARGEIRGGRFVKGFGGEQFALPEALGRLRAARNEPQTGELIALSAADPLNLVGILTPEARVPAIAGNRVLLRDGVPIAALEGGALRRLADDDLPDESLRPLFWRRSATDTRVRVPVKSRQSVRQSLLHGGAGITAKPMR
jgi:ATP-dependent Lhr-like helicase